jgi:hypothetical protein
MCSGEPPDEDRVIFLAALWLWNACPSGEVPVAYRVEWVRRAPVGYVDGTDDSGQPVLMPVYSAWGPMLLQQSPEMRAEVPCEPAAGEVCATIVTSLDEWGMEDSGETCN